MTPLETDADLALFFDPDDFGTVVQVDGADVSGIFVNGFAGTAFLEGTAPSLTCRSADVSGVSRGSEVVVPGQGTFAVITVRNDGTGVARIQLEAV